MIRIIIGFPKTKGWMTIPPAYFRTWRRTKQVLCMWMAKKMFCRLSNGKGGKWTSCDWVLSKRYKVGPVTRLQGKVIPSLIGVRTLVIHVFLAIYTTMEPKNILKITTFGIRKMIKPPNLQVIMWTQPWNIFREPCSHSIYNWVLGGAHLGVSPHFLTLRLSSLWSFGGLISPVLGCLYATRGGSRSPAGSWSFGEWKVQTKTGWKLTIQ